MHVGSRTLREHARVIGLNIAVGFGSGIAVSACLAEYASGHA